MVVMVVMVVMLQDGISLPSLVSLPKSNRDQGVHTHKWLAPRSSTFSLFTSHRENLASRARQILKATQRVELETPVHIFNPAVSVNHVCPTTTTTTTHHGLRVRQLQKVASRGHSQMLLEMLRDPILLQGLPKGRLEGP